MILFDVTEETSEKISHITLGFKSNVYDLLDNKAHRIKGLSGILASASCDEYRTGLSPSDVCETATAIYEEVRIILCLLEQLAQDNRAKPSIRT
jgi:hypothetical protein